MRVDIFKRKESDGFFSYLLVPEGKNLPGEVTNTVWAIESRGLDPRAVIITNGFHEYRACLIAKGLGIEAYPCAARSVYTVLPAQYIRELMSILNQLLFA